MVIAFAFDRSGRVASQHARAQACSRHALPQCHRVSVCASDNAVPQRVGPHTGMPPQGYTQRCNDGIRAYLKREGQQFIGPLRFGVNAEEEAEQDRLRMCEANAAWRQAVSSRWLRGQPAPVRAPAPCPKKRTLPTTEAPPKAPVAAKHRPSVAPNIYLQRPAGSLIPTQPNHPPPPWRFRENLIPSQGTQ